MKEAQKIVDIPCEVVATQPKKRGNKAWVPGKSGNPLGRPAGGTNEKTRLWEELGMSITTVHAQTFNEKLTQLFEEQPEKGMYMYLQVLEYFKPKLNRTTLVGDPDKPLEVKTASFE